MRLRFKKPVFLKYLTSEKTVFMSKYKSISLPAVNGQGSADFCGAGSGAAAVFCLVRNLTKQQEREQEREGETWIS